MQIAITEHMPTHTVKSARDNAWIQIDLYTWTCSPSKICIYLPGVLVEYETRHLLHTSCMQSWWPRRRR